MTPIERVFAAVERYRPGRIGSAHPGAGRRIRPALWAAALLACAAVTAAAGAAPRGRTVHHAPAGSRAASASCSQNLCRLGKAMRLYLQAHERRLPSADGWTDALAPYLREIKARDACSCPQHPSRPYAYAMNRLVAGKVIGDENLWGRVLLFESSAGKKNAADEGQSVCSPPRHKGGNYYLFVDGRVELRKGRPPF